MQVLRVLKITARILVRTAGPAQHVAPKVTIQMKEGPSSRTIGGDCVPFGWDARITPHNGSREGELWLGT